MKTALLSVGGGLIGFAVGFENPWHLSMAMVGIIAIIVARDYR